MRTHFDKAYYDRYYRNPHTRAMTPQEARRLAEFVAAYLRHLTVPVKHVVDIGCGIGTILRAVGKCFPHAKLTGVETSDYLCQHYGWENGSVIDYQTTGVDLVVCNDVLGYLSDQECSRAIGNLAALTQHAAYLGIFTTEDLALCDTERTDPQQLTRPAAWYQRRLAPHFFNVGGGLYLKKPLGVPVWTLDRLG